MKRVLLLLILTAFFYGCTSTIPDTKEQFYTIGFDFNKYVEQGFLITPGDYKGDYDVMGLMECSVTPEIVKMLYDENMFLIKPKDGTRYYYAFVGGNGCRVKTVNADSLISYMHKQALALNADAIINFTITSEPMQYYNIPVPKVTGIAIRRKK